MKARDTTGAEWKTYVYIYIYTYKHTYIHTYTHTYRHLLSSNFSRRAASSIVLSPRIYI